jgi:hypothetical protein
MKTHGPDRSRAGSLSLLPSPAIATNASCLPSGDRAMPGSSYGISVFSAGGSSVASPIQRGSLATS